MALAKIEHPELLSKLARQFPTMTALADHLGVTRERVRQLLRKQGCTGFRKRSQKRICPQCGGTKYQTAQLCRSCYSKNHRVLVACDNCDKLKEIYVSRLIFNTRHCKHWYCSRSCQTTVLGKTYGFGVHPENQRKGRQYPLRWNPEPVWQKHLETGYGAIRLSRLLGIPKGTVSVILWNMRKKKRGGLE